MFKLNNIIGRLSIARIVIWALLAFVGLNYVYSVLFPPKPLGNVVASIINEMSPADVIMGMQPGDPRIVERHYSPAPDDLTVAWVTDSSPTILRANGGGPNDFDRVDYVQEIILRKQPLVGGQPLRFAMYMQVFGPKALDKYYEAQHAIALKPDLLIYGVNPTFDFTPWDMMGEGAVPGALASFGSVHTLKWTLLLASPSQILQGVLMRFVPTIERRFDIGVLFEEVRNALDLFGLRDVTLPQKHRVGHFLWYRAYWEGLLPSVDTTDDTATNVKQVVSSFDSAGRMSQVNQLIAMRLADLDDHSWGKVLLRELVQDLRNSGTPALIYMIPVNLEVIESDPIVASKFHALEQWFAGFARENSDENIRIVPSTPSRFLPELSFYDISHLTNAEPFADYMLAEIKNNAKER